ncbi:MAG: helix-turn-helix transcriptional regulator [Clostridia bacterium]|nr:helix-turn-helix transcriptional regulator [Clostridia bacterium]
MNKTLLCDRITAAGLTHADVAKALGIGKNTFSAYLNSEKSFRLDQVNIMCELLGIYDDTAKVKIFLL